MRDGTVEVHELLKHHELSKWMAFLTVRERKYQTFLIKKNQKIHHAAICNFTRKRFAEDFDQVVQGRLVRKKRRIPLPFEAQANDFEERVVYTTRY